MLFEDVIRKREACRKFSDYRLTDEELDKILEAGRLAPSAKNLQPIKIIVCRSEDSLYKIDIASPCRYGAQQVLIVCGMPNFAYKEGDYSGYEVDASICATHMILEATNIGIDSIWVRMFDSKKIKELFQLDQELEPICLMPLGKKAVDAPISPNHNKRKDKSELVDYV